MVASSLSRKDASNIEQGIMRKTRRSCHNGVTTHTSCPDPVTAFIHSFIPDFYIAPLQETYSEALSVQLRSKRNVLRSLQKEDTLLIGICNSICIEIFSDVFLPICFDGNNHYSIELKLDTCTHRVMPASIEMF